MAALELYRTDFLGDNASASPFKCSVCGRVALWERIEGDQWWLKIPCECGSQKFKVEVGQTTWHGVYGTNG